MKEAPSIEGAFLFQRNPYRGSHRGWGTDGGGVGRVGRVARQAVPLGGWILIHQSRTHHRHLDYNCEDVWV